MPATHLPGEVVATTHRPSPLPTEAAGHAAPWALRTWSVTEGPEEVAEEEPAPTGRMTAAGPWGGGSGGSEVQREAASPSASWEQAGPEGAPAGGRDGECGERGAPWSSWLGFCGNRLTAQ